MQELIYIVYNYIFYRKKIVNVTFAYTQMDSNFNLCFEVFKK